MNSSPYKIAFFGTPRLAETILQELDRAQLMPDLVVSAPDKPKGRKLALTPPEAKVWAEAHGIPVYQPQTLRSSKAKEMLTREKWDLFVVAAYGFILPKDILDIPRYGTLNVHPSLLPRLRGASPIHSALLEEEITGVSIILLDEQMDHGPILAQKEVAFPRWPIPYTLAEDILATEGGKLLAETITKWIKGDIEPKVQDHSKATFSKKIQKNDAYIDLASDPKENYRKILAFEEWPKPYFFCEKDDKKMRVIIKSAEISDGTLKILRVTPEGKKEMDYGDFQKWIKTP